MSHHKCCCEPGIHDASCPCSTMPVTLFVTDSHRGITVTLSNLGGIGAWYGELTTTVPPNSNDVSCDGTTLGTIGYGINCGINHLRFQAQAGCGTPCVVGTTGPPFSGACTQTGIFTPTDSGNSITPTSCSPLSATYTTSVQGRVALFFFGDTSLHSITFTITG